MHRSLVFLFAVATVYAAPPTVAKVEPPNWWAGHSINPVRVLLTGENLGGASVAPYGGLSATHIRYSENGHYLFADITIPATTKPGPYPLTVRTPDGDTVVGFQIEPALGRQGRFRGFSPDDVIYLLMPDRFANGDPGNDDPPGARGLFNRKQPRYYHGGDLQGVIDHLPYLSNLGVTAIWMNPIYDNVNRLNERERYDNKPVTDYHGYGAVDFYAVDEHLGDLDKLRELVEAAHHVGIKVIQDQVANHTSPYHPWVEDPPSQGWFNGSASIHLNNNLQGWTLMDPHATPDLRRAALTGWFNNILPDLNQDDPETRRYLIQNALWWMGTTGFDGIREDTWQYVPREFWRDYMAALKKEYPASRVVGEVFDADPSFVSFFEGGRKQYDGVDDGVDSLFDFPLYYRIRSTFAAGRPLRDIAVLFAHDRLYLHPNRLVTFLGLHDVPRFMSEEGATIDGLKLAFTLLATARGIPMIYYGDEIGMSGGGDPDNRRDFPGGWREDGRNAFLDQNRTRNEQAIYAHLRRLLELRKQHPALRTGNMITLSVTEQTYVFARAETSETAIIVMNNDKRPALVEAPVKLPEGTTLDDELGTSRARVSGGELRIQLPARSAALLFVKH